MEWKNIYRGFFMGTSDLVPGVSGGTIAVLLGIYDRLISSISGLFSKEWRKHLGFLIPLGLGMATAVLLLSKLIKYLYEHYPQQTEFFFLGLIIGILPYLFKEANVKETFKIQHVIFFIMGAILISLMIFRPEVSGSIMDRSLGTYILLFFSGMAGSAAMILPGISGSLMLYIIGVYWTVISAINNLELDVLAVVGLGIVIGIIVMSKIIQFFLTNYRTATFALILGLVTGSVVVVYPDQGFPVETISIIVCIGTFACGLLLAYILSRVEHGE